MRKLCVEGTACNFELLTHTGFPNAVRRALLTDVSRYAPLEVEIAENTSSQTDEYIAHRIGLIPFELTGDPKEKILLNVKGREVCAFDFEGDSFRAVENVPIILLSNMQELKIRVSFTRGAGRDHARFALIGPVTYKVERAGEDGKQKKTCIGFETINKESPLTYLLDALLELDAKIEAARFFVEQSYDSKRRLLSEKKK